MVDIKLIASVAHALSDPIRVEIVEMLRRQNDVCACHIQEGLNLSQSKASYHLKILVDAGLLRRETRGTWSHYSLVDAARTERLLDVLS
jgi:ArsR family transcriptional regulator